MNLVYIFAFSSSQKKLKPTHPRSLVFLALLKKPIVFVKATSSYMSSNDLLAFKKALYGMVKVNLKYVDSCQT